MTTQRVVVGAHYGLKDWLAQRVSAVVLAVYSLVLFFAWLGADKVDYRSWVGVFAGSWMKVLTLLAIANAPYSWPGVGSALV